MGDNMPLKIFFTMLSFILGCYIVELNQNNKFKHNILIGTIAYIFLLIASKKFVISRVLSFGGRGTVHFQPLLW